MYTLAIVISDARAWPIAVGLLHAVRGRQQRVALFAMSDAVGAAAFAPHLHALQALADDGADLVACATSVAANDHGNAPWPAWWELGSQHDHARLLATSQRVVALT